MGLHARARIVLHIWKTVKENLFSFSGVAASATRRGGLPDGDAAMIEAGG
jgi:hypothetical protein